MNDTPASDTKQPQRLAPGWPGIEPRWTSSDKSALGTALGEASRVWFTASHGILNEIYYPEVDMACTRDAGFLVSAADGLLSEEKRHCAHAVEWRSPGVPAFRLTNSALDGRYLIEKRICCAPDYDAVVQHTHFDPTNGRLEDYFLTFLISPHLGNRGRGNTAWLGDHKGVPLLFAQREGWSLAVACSAGWGRRSAGFVGRSDAWNDLRENGRMTWQYDRAENGNVAIAGEIDLHACGGTFLITIGFGSDPETAAVHARSALVASYDDTERRFAEPWVAWQQSLRRLDEPEEESPLNHYRASTAVMKTHTSMNSAGGVIASLSVPWGTSKSDGDLGGYHLVWPRDMVETAGGFLAAGATADLEWMLRFLAVTQESDGHWPQNMWLNGVPFWNGLQLDEAAFPVLLVDLARREGVLDVDMARCWWPMARRAASYVARMGPATQQDRWEEDAGFSPFSLAVSVSALVVAAEYADEAGEPDVARYFRDTADDWNESIERWTYAADTPLSARLGVRGYYVRIGSADTADAASPVHGFVPIKNRTGDRSSVDASELVSTDALALVRFGLRSPNDPRIQDTVLVIDALLRRDTLTGPVWHRYNEDGYGEHDDGSAFDGTGTGRGWPLLAGERAHYELALGNRAEAERLASVIRAQTSAGGLIPEQVWDAPDIVELELFNGRPAGSAMPLVWAHAEYVKLLRSLRDGRVFDCPAQSAARYVTSTNVPRVALWRFTLQRRGIPTGRNLRLDTLAPARVRWSADAWTTWDDLSSMDLGVGVYTTELPTAILAPGTTVHFTFYWPDVDRWEGSDFAVIIVKDEQVKSER
jgi:glucoamylase